MAQRNILDGQDADEPGRPASDEGHRRGSDEGRHTNAARRTPAVRRDGDRDHRAVLPPFEAVVARYGPVVLRVCRAVLGPTGADDAWSETFLSAMRAYPDLPAGSNIEAWLVTIAHHRAIDQVRAAARRAVPTDDLPEQPTGDGVPGGWESDLWATLKLLPLKQRQCVAYHYLAGLPYADVARVLGGTTDAARRAAADGIAALRKTYRDGARS